MKEKLMPVFVLAAAVGLFTTCKEQTEDLNLKMGYEYFPLEQGRVWVYAVDTIVYDPAVGGTAVDSVRVYFRDEVLDSIAAEDGEVQYRVDRQIGNSDAGPWAPHNVYYLSRNDRNAYLTEDNLRFNKLIFPLQPGKKWNGTGAFEEFKEVEIAGERLEMFKGWESRTAPVIPSLVLGNLAFENVQPVQVADYEAIIERRYGLEYYAPNAGLIYRELWILDSQCQVCCNGDLGACDGLSWRDKAEKGFIFRQQLIIN